MKQQIRPLVVVTAGAAVVVAFFILGVALGPGMPLLSVGDSRTIANFEKLFYYRGERTWNDSHWLGVPVQKSPTDLMTYQEILYDTKPDVLVEAGTFKGGSALFFASLMDLLNKGRVVTIDVANYGRPTHPRITYLQGFSTAPDVVAAVKGQIRAGDVVMVVLDSDHSYANVLAELRAYSPLVTKGAYLVVEDTILNGHPVLPDVGPGPWEAVDEFFTTDSRFVRDRAREKYLMTFNPGGFLRKVR